MSIHSPYRLYFYFLFLIFHIYSRYSLVLKGEALGNFSSYIISILQYSYKRIFFLQSNNASMALFVPVPKFEIFFYLFKNVKFYN